MRILKTNRDGIFILYIIVTLLFSVVIYAEHGQKLAGVIGVALFPLIGSFFYLNDLKNALKAIFSLIFITVSLGLGAGASYLLLYLQLSLEVALVVGCVLSVSILFFLFYNSVPSLLAQKLSNSKAGREKQEELRMTYHKYKSVCYNAWYQALPSSISNQTKAMAGFRIAAMVICITTGFWGIFLRPVLIFGGEPVFDSLLCIAMMLSGVLIFFCGFFAALLGALCLCALIGLTLLIHRPLDAMNLSAFSHNLFTSLIAAASCGLPIAFIYGYYRNDLLYSNVQIFERGDSCIATDLFLYELKPVEDLPMLLSFSMNFPEELRSTRILVNVLKFLVKLCHKNQSIFAGYHSTSNENFMRFYIYTRKERSGLTEAITARAQQLGLHVDHVQFEEDENWQTYMNYLYPTQREFCSIISRSYMEQLFLDGVSFDYEYDLSFFVDFKHKNDPVDFEQELRYYGFTLSYASFDEERDEVNPEYLYYGEYKIKSFISPRRIDYLNELLMEQSERFGALYLGDWEISS